MRVSCTPVTVASPVTSPVVNSSPDLPWTQPCQPSPGPHHAPHWSVDSPETTTAHESALVIESAEAFSMALMLKQHIFVHRLSANLIHAQLLEDEHFDPLPVVGSMLSWAHFHKTSDILTSNYKHISYILAFLELTEHDCSGVDVRSDNVLLQVRTLQRKLYDILCHTKCLLHALGTSVDRHVDRHEVPPYLRNIPNLAHIADRDYIIVKDAVHILRKVKDTHLRVEERRVASRV